MSVDARNNNYELVTVLDQLALFTCARIDRKTVPEGLYVYDVRSDDDGQGCPCEIAPFIMVNHWGTIITDQPIDLTDDNNTRRYLKCEEVEYDDEEKEEFEEDSYLSCSDWNYEGGGYSLLEYLSEIRDDIRGTISNEHLWELGYDGNDLNPHTQNIEKLKKHLQSIDEMIDNILKKERNSSYESL